MNKSHLTAMNRKTLSAPMKWMWENELFTDSAPWKCLDYGCGKGKDADHFEFDKYDLFWFPEFPSKTYDIITCNYVLNVIPDEAERLSVLEKIKNLLDSQGNAYISIRCDMKELKGLTKRGTYQGYHPPALPLVHKASGFEIYRLKKD